MYFYFNLSLSYFNLILLEYLVACPKLVLLVCFYTIGTALAQQAVAPFVLYVYVALGAVFLCAKRLIIEVFLQKTASLLRYATIVGSYLL